MGGGSLRWNFNRWSSMNLFARVGPEFSYFSPHGALATVYYYGFNFKTDVGLKFTIGKVCFDICYKPTKSNLHLAGNPAQGDGIFPPLYSKNVQRFAFHIGLLY